MKNRQRAGPNGLPSFGRDAKAPRRLMPAERFLLTYAIMAIGKTRRFYQYFATWALVTSAAFLMFSSFESL